MGQVPRPAGPSDALSVVGVWNPKGYGVKVDGVTDDRAALQALFNTVSAAGGGVVLQPPGDCLLTSTSTTTLTIPTNVCWTTGRFGPLSHNGFRDGSPFPTSGPSRLLMPTGGTVDYVHPYIQVNSLNGANASMSGFLLYAPGQSHTASTPTACPPWIAIRGKNGSVLDCELLNPYWGIDVNNPSDSQVTERPTVERVTGQPLSIGLSIGDQGHNGIADIPRLIDVHWNPWWADPATGPAVWASANGTAFLVGDVDEIVIRGCFCYGYDRGFRAILGAVSGAQIPARGPYGSWQGGGFDACNIPVQVDASQPQSAVRFDGVGFVSANGAAKIGLIANGSAGPIGLVNCDFWGVSNGSAAQLASARTTTFTGCRFNTYSGGAIRISAGQVIVVGCDFQLPSGTGGAAIAQSGSGVVSASGNLQKTAWTVTGTIGTTAANGSY